MEPTRYALVTGGSGAIGAAIAEELSAAGFGILLHYHHGRDNAEQVKGYIESNGSDARLVSFDVTDGPAVDAAIRDVLSSGIEIVVLVNGAGTLCDAMFLEQSPEEWRSVTRTTLDGFYNVTRSVLLPMVRRRWGRVVNIASVAGLVGNPGQVAYSAARAGLSGATRSLAKEVAGRGVTVNAVAPGFIDSAMTRRLPSPAVKIPVGRLGTPQDVAKLVAFLAGPDAGYITGQVLTIDGGLV